MSQSPPGQCFQTLLWPWLQTACLACWQMSFLNHTAESSRHFGSNGKAHSQEWAPQTTSECWITLQIQFCYSTIATKWSGEIFLKNSNSKILPSYKSGGCPWKTDTGPGQCHWHWMLSEPLSMIKDSIVPTLLLGWFMHSIIWSISQLTDPDDRVPHSLFCPYCEAGSAGAVSPNSPSPLSS